MSSHDRDQRIKRKISRHIGHTQDEPVGFKHPPRAFQFKKGQSGNPKGRPKGSKNRPRFGTGELMGSIFVSARRELSHQFETIIKQYEIAYDQKLQQERRRNGLPPINIYPKPQHITYLPNGYEMEVFGPISKEEDIEWKKLIKEENQYLSDRAQMRGAKNRNEDDAPTKDQLQEEIDKLDVFLKRIREKKEKFRRIMPTPKFSKAINYFSEQVSKKKG